jgi:hypothetical protein
MNHKGSGLIARVAQYAVALLGILFFIMIYSGNDSGIDGGLYVTYVAFFLGAGMALVFSLVGLTKKSLIGMGGFLVLLAISYALADGSVRPEWGITESTSKWIGTGIIMFVIAMVGAVGAIVVGEVSRVFK